MTSDEAAILEDLRRLLPTIKRNDVAALTLFDAPVALDCEWDPETGALKLIGIGNHGLIVHIWWGELDDEARWTAQGAVQRVVQDVKVVYHNADADLRKLRAFGFLLTVEMHHQLEDTMLKHAVLHAEEEHTLEYLSSERGKLPPHKWLKDIDPTVYNACDLLQTLYVDESLDRELIKDPAAARVYRTQSLAKLPYIIRDEERGIRVNQTVVYPMRDKFAAKREQASRLAVAYTGWPINLGSPAEFKRALYDIEGLPVQRAKAAPGAEGVPTTDKDAIATLRRLFGTEWDPDESPMFNAALANIDAGGHPLLEARYLYFGAQQAISHYIDPCIVFESDKVAGIRERIYPETRQHVQTSGRDSYVGTDEPDKSGMAMQQLKGELETLVCPDEGTVWLGWDWSNIETWLLGVLAGDEPILEAKDKGWDTHTLNYCDITGTALPPVLTKALHKAPECEAWRKRLKWQGEDDTRRVFSKRYVYRLHYRGDPARAGDIPGAKALGFNADRLVDASVRYLSKHHWIVEYWKRIEHVVDKFGVVYTWDGRPRRLTSPYRNARYREGCNHPMQGGVAGIYNTTRLAIHRALPWLDFVYGKHDSQWWQCPVDRMDEAWPVIKAVVQRTFRINGRNISFPASFKERTAA